MLRIVLNLSDLLRYWVSDPLIFQICLFELSSNGQSFYYYCDINIKDSALCISERTQSNTNKETENTNLLAILSGLHFWEPQSQRVHKYERRKYGVSRIHFLLVHMRHQLKGCSHIPIWVTLWVINMHQHQDLSARFTYSRWICDFSPSTALPACRAFRGDV